ncbi:lytic murein transglycosylase [Solicola gregarius]|uniref:Lytic murein transglycosylase n=1 Tax=Solicola gregarius TaxID=2908642 RepID=A0AA46YLG9_9ACTN|nr:lytic murein transglycosylase [Solicola gregarius]UYM06930.1 lytic murein transglycosylase [Solicola gregarius]
MANAKASCKLDWTLVAAIGRVESDHGQYGGSQIDTTGDSDPKIIGIPLDGSNNTAAISDTDGGQLDGDSTWDRAVGPMQFIPSTWDLVGVDGNGDGVKSPHNIYDAALATAVYLCASDEDVSTEGGASEAVFSYNHSNDYVATVLAIADRYKDGDFTETPSIYLPETPDSDDELFDPDTYDPGPESDGNGNGNGNNSDGDNGSGGKNELKPTTFGPGETGDGGPHQIQPIETGGSGHSNGPGPDEVGAAEPEHDNQLEEQVIGSGPNSGKPTDPHGTNKPDEIHGFVDDKSPKNHKPKNDGKPDGPGVDIRPTKDDPKTKGPGVDVKPTQDDPKTKDATKPKGAQSDVRPKHLATTKPREGGATVRPKHRAEDTEQRPKTSAGVAEACTDGSEELQADGTKLSEKQADALVTDCVDNSSVVWSQTSGNPVLDWMTAQVSEL